MRHQRMSLSGVWDLRWSDGQRGGLAYHHLRPTDGRKWLEARVPGEVHLDLLRAGLASEPTEGINVLESRWVEESFWTYRRTFRVPQDALSVRSWLTFQALDYGATIYLNEQCIGTHANAFRPCEIEVTGKLVSGENLLVVVLESGLYSVSEKAVKGLYRGAEDGRLYKRMWLRKPQFSFSWDWAPRLINIGIEGDVDLSWAEHLRVVDCSVGSELSQDRSLGTVAVSMTLQGLKPSPVTADIMVRVNGTSVEVKRSVAVNPGIQTVKIAAEVPEPKCWWPIGHGLQERYGVEVEVLVDGVLTAHVKKTVGFRHVRINQDDDPRGGNYFTLEVNGRPIFAKGANWVPPDILLARIDSERYQTLISRAMELHFNFLRIWGGGIYERDEFYDLCDAHGILVWQEFAFACAAYPATDAEFLNEIAHEARYQVRRLLHHPSLIAWCGNNEIEWLNWDRNEGVVRPDYGWFHQSLPRILREEDPSRWYQPSSPYSPDGSFPNAEDRGDQHPWDIGFGNVDFHGYRQLRSRFPNEGGVLGPPPLPTLEAALPADQRQMHSFAWELHDNSVEDWFPESAIDALVSEWTGKSATQMSLEEYVYYGGLLQGEGLREYIDNFRRRKFETGSAIFWMYNDCWPTTRSWTVVDYYLRRTAAFYPVRRAFAPLSVVLVKDNEMVRVYGVNDTLMPWRGTLRCGIFTLQGTYPMTTQSVVEVPSNASIPLACFPVKDWETVGTHRAIAYAELVQGEETVARNRLFVQRFKDMQWMPANVQVTRSDGGAVFSSNTFVWGVCIDLHGEAVGDNFFDVWPNKPYRVSWPQDRALPKILFVGNLES